MIDNATLMRKEIARQLLAVFFFFCLGFVLGQGFILRMETTKAFLSYFMIPLSLSIIGFIIAGRVTRVFVFQLFICLVGIVSSILMFILMYSHLLLTSSTNQAGLILCINVFLIFSMVLLSIQSEKENFSHAEKLNIQSGKIDLKNKVWDLQKKTYWDDSEEEETRRKTFQRIKRLSIFIPGIAFFIARFLNPSPESVQIFTVLVFAYFFAYFSGRNINLLFQICRWENKIGDAIRLK